MGTDGSEAVGRCIGCHLCQSDRSRSLIARNDEFFSRTSHGEKHGTHARPCDYASDAEHADASPDEIMRMRIAHESPDVLVVTEPAAALRISGGAVALIGALLLAEGMRTGGAVSDFAGAMTLIVGTLLVLLPVTTTMYFNRAERRLLVAPRRLWQWRSHSGYNEYPLNQVVAAQVDQSKSGSDGSAWRVIVRLTDGRTLPFTSYYTSGYGSKAAAANQICEYLGVAPATQSFAGASSPHVIARRSRRAALAIAAMLAVFGGVFAGIGGRMLLREYRRLAEWTPVQATVIATHVESHSDSDGTTYSPVVVYRYWVNDQQFTSRRALPVNESRSGRWAYRVIERFSAGGTYTAWYDPGNPSDAFIVRAHSIIAPVFTLIGALVIVAACAVAASARRANEG